MLFFIMNNWTENTPRTHKGKEEEGITGHDFHHTNG